jgi:hypothetical protein
MPLVYLGIPARLDVTVDTVKGLGRVFSGISQMGSRLRASGAGAPAWSALEIVAEDLVVQSRRPGGDMRAHDLLRFLWVGANDGFRDA